MFRRVVHRLRPISSQIFQNGVLASTNSANRAFSAAVNRGFAIATLPIGSNPDQVSRFDDPLRPQAMWDAVGSAEVTITDADLADIDVPTAVVAALRADTVPGFDRFEVACDPRAIHLTERPAGTFVVLGETPSGALGVRCTDGSVWWLQNAVEGPPGLSGAAYDQFMNTDVDGYRASVRAYDGLLAGAGPDAESLRDVLISADPGSLRAEGESVWLDVLLDWDAGL